MGSWAKGFMAGCVSVLAAVMLISVLTLPSIGDIMDAVSAHGNSVVSSVFSAASKSSSSAPPGMAVEFLSADNINGVMDNNTIPFGSNGFDDW